jgi:toxin secretion/phage lysis holin
MKKGGEHMEAFYPVIVALVFNGLDLVTGIITAVKNHEIQSSKLRDGLFKKVGFLLCYFVAWLIDTQGSLIGFNLTTPILPIIITYVCLTELVSILENISKINPDILPDKLMELFHINSLKGDETNAKH